jgi:glutaredoxin 3
VFNLKHLLAALMGRSAPVPMQGTALDSSGQAHALVLYKFDACPYCQRVMDFLRAHPIPVTYKDIRKEPASREALLQLGGKTQVPCLVIDGQPLYESADIVSYLKQYIAKQGT